MRLCCLCGGISNCNCCSLLAAILHCQTGMMVVVPCSCALHSEVYCLFGCNRTDVGTKRLAFSQAVASGSALQHGVCWQGTLLVVSCCTVMQGLYLHTLQEKSVGDRVLPVQADCLSHTL
jgi:hypothetical protein